MDYRNIIDNVVKILKSNITQARTIDIYRGDEIDYDLVEELFPAIYVTYESSKYDWIDNINYNEQVIFKIIIIGQNGDKIENITNEVLNILTNNNLNLEIEKIKPLQTELIEINELLITYQITFQTNFDNEYLGGNI